MQKVWCAPGTDDVESDDTDDAETDDTELMIEWYWWYFQGNCWNCYLLELMQKCDAYNTCTGKKLFLFRKIFIYKISFFYVSPALFPNLSTDPHL